MYHLLVTICLHITLKANVAFQIFKFSTVLSKLDSSRSRQSCTLCTLCDTIRHNMIWYDGLYLRAPKSWRITSLICRTEPNKKRVMKKVKTKTEMLRRNGPVIKSEQSVLRSEGSLWLEKFVKRQVLRKEWKREGLMDSKSGELTEWEDVVGAWIGKSETEGLECGCKCAGQRRC